MIEEYVRELYSYPVGTSQHNTTLKNIQCLLYQESNMHDFNICFPSRYNKKVTNSVAKKLKTVNGLVDIDFYDNYLFSNKKTFAEDSGNFEIKQRYELEYNLKYQQLTVAAYITDGVSVVMLKSNKGRLKDKTTLIQGHVDYTSDCLTMSQVDFLEMNIRREIQEELIIGDANTRHQVMNNIKPKFYMSAKDSLISLEHFGIIYEVFVDNISELDFASGEPDKHTVDIISLDISSLSSFTEFDGWSYEVYKKLKY